jgi:hypothetical protein
MLQQLSPGAVRLVAAREGLQQQSAAALCACASLWLLAAARASQAPAFPILQQLVSGLLQILALTCSFVRLGALSWQPPSLQQLLVAALPLALVAVHGCQAIDASNLAAAMCRSLVFFFTSAFGSAAAHAVVAGAANLAAAACSNFARLQCLTFGLAAPHASAVNVRVGLQRVPLAAFGFVTAHQTAHGRLQQQPPTALRCCGGCVWLSFGCHLAQPSSLPVLQQLPVHRCRFVAAPPVARVPVGSQSSVRSGLAAARCCSFAR